MASAQSAVGAYHDAPSMLRASLTSFTPIRTRETVKLWYGTIRREFIRYELPEETESFEDYLTLKHDAVFNIIPIPDKFEKDKLADLFCKRSINLYKDDKEIHEIIDNIKDFKKTALSPFLNLIILIKNRYRNNIDKTLKEYAEILLETDMPFKIMSAFARSQKIYAQILNQLDSIFYRHDRILDSNISKGGRTRAEDVYNLAKEEVDSTFNIAEPWFFNKTCLDKMLIVWNADSYDDIFDLKETRYDAISERAREDYNRIFLSFRDNMKIVRKYILNSRYSRPRITRDVQYPSSNMNFNQLLSPIFLYDVTRL